MSASCVRLPRRRIRSVRYGYSCIRSRSETDRCRACPRSCSRHPCGRASAQARRDAHVSHLCPQPEPPAGASASSATAREWPVNHGDLRSAKSPSASRADSRASPLSRALAALPQRPPPSTPPRAQRGVRTTGASAETRLGVDRSAGVAVSRASAASTPRLPVLALQPPGQSEHTCCERMSSPADRPGRPCHPSARTSAPAAGSRLAKSQPLGEAAGDPAIRDVSLHHGTHAAEHLATRLLGLAATARRSAPARARK